MISHTDDDFPSDPDESAEPHRGIRSTHKTPTTPDVTEGIKLAIEGAIAKSSISLESVSSVMIGTTVSNFYGPS